jgi:DNA-binding NarL/FixJ family response regulator
VDVFVVEDSAEFRQRLIAAIEEVPDTRVAGWAGGEDEAIADIGRLRPRFVVLDIWLAQGSGLGVLEAVKRLDPPPFVAVLTNYPEPQYRARCAELGADAFFIKAAGLDSLLESVRGAVGRSELFAPLPGAPGDRGRGDRRAGEEDI